MIAHVRAVDHDTGRAIAKVHRRGPVTVADVMSRPLHVTDPNAPVREIAHRILTLGHREIVVTVGNRPQGVITVRHLAAMLQPASDGWTPRYAADLLPARNPRLLPDLDLTAAAAVMTSDALDAVTVVDRDGALLGIIAHRHLVGHSPGDRDDHHLGSTRRGNVADSGTPGSDCRIPATMR